MVDYNEYAIPTKMKLVYALSAATVVFAVSYLFYRSFTVSIAISPLGIFYLNYRRKQIIEKRKNELNLQFKDLLISLSSSLSAGKPLEKAFVGALSDLYVLYPSDDAYIVRETKIIINKLSLNVSIEEAVSDFAERSDIDDIKNFSDVIIICKRTGGNLVDAIKNSSRIISEKIEMAQEIETLLSSRKLEQKVLNIMPIAMIFILSTTATEYINPVFTTVTGRIAATLCLILLTAAYFISKRIINIKM
ncbi:type II secretion system F family protein [Ruminiclostridium cellulolyticum]|uniref:Flp pilus assembly protein TadB-like protein n=1 Tax=Ruminiclostridium cellulolyticum (strain ATCC 35319 / DSM 5812 / JCM 6584 / H10) TaxID=394503 RepID=B8I6J4_RUMCH|nr:type II secretion system F family protein [Ruminiclostridium cellulolyticum]ACL74886.1 Flp pilus assembly protein TadB-like protein [Ruminiclostridium cellulolyticum H10]